MTPAQWSRGAGRSRCSATSCRRSATRATRWCTPGGRSRRTRSRSAAGRGRGAGPGGRRRAARPAAMAAAVGPRTKVVLVCSPNNPTGPAVRAASSNVPRRGARATCSSCWTRRTSSSSAIPDAPDGARVPREHPNVVVLRTFSKAYGLAGLRVGYAVAHPDAGGRGAHSVDPVRGERDRAGGGVGVTRACRTSWPSGSMPWSPSASGCSPRCGARAGTCLTVAGELRLARHGGAHVRAGRGRRRARPGAASVRRGGLRVTIGEPEANDRVLRVVATWR